MFRDHINRFAFIAATGMVNKFYGHVTTQVGPVTATVIQLLPYTHLTL